jgi:uncharacterized protein (DUF2147 family)
MPRTNMSTTLPTLAAHGALVVGLLLAAPAQAADLQGFGGYWRTPDQSVVEIKACPAGESLCGYLVFAREQGTDTLNPDPALRSRPLCGLPILELKRLEAGVWRDGTVYDPETGKSYSAALRQREGRLFLRAYIGTEAFGETETWVAASDFKPACPR